MMVKIYVQFPEDLQARAETAARKRGITFEEFVRECVLTSVSRTRSTDPLFADSEVYTGDAPTDLAQNHDRYLYESDK